MDLSAKSCSHWSISGGFQQDHDVKPGILVFVLFFFIYRTSPLLLVRVKGWIFSCFHPPRTSMQSSFSSLMHREIPRGLGFANFDCYVCKHRRGEDRHRFVPAGSLHKHNHHPQCTVLPPKGTCCQVLLLIHKPAKHTFSSFVALQGRACCHLGQRWPEEMPSLFPGDPPPGGNRGQVNSFAALEDEDSGSSPSCEAP